MFALSLPDGHVGANLLKYAPISRSIRIIKSVPEHGLFHNL